MSIRDVDYIRILLRGVYSQHEISVWLSSPQALLGGDVPYALIDRGEAERVKSVAEQLVDSVYL